MLNGIKERDVDLNLGENFLILSTCVCAFLPFNRLGNGGGGTETQGEEVGMLLGGVELSFDSSPLESSTSLGGSASTTVGFTTKHGGVGEEGAGEGSSFACGSPT